MIQSMTGFGAAQLSSEGVSYSFEIRSVNNRFLKHTIKLPESIQYLESEIDKTIRKRLARGSVSSSLRVRSEDELVARPLNLVVLQQYAEQLAQLKLAGDIKPTIDLAALVMMPGVYATSELDDEAKAKTRRAVIDLTNQAITALIEIRGEEGKTLRADLLAHCQSIRECLAEVATRAPSVVDEYHERLKTRVSLLMKEGGFELEAEGLAREVAIYAERCDINEELSRLSSHLDQAVQLCDRGDQVGRTLDFLTQEMLREANTIASKSNDSSITRNVVEIKGLIDRLKEQVQNVE
jgi:uncharacterized protein (TIGR00255 family)